MRFPRSPLARFSALLFLAFLAFSFGTAGAAKHGKDDHPRGKSASRPGKDKKKAAKKAARKTGKPKAGKSGKKPGREPEGRAKAGPKSVPALPAIPVDPVDPDTLPPVGFETRPEALSSFFRDLAALEAARPGAGSPRVVRVLHFGDSHVTVDYWTGEIRRWLQERFGDAGAGYVMPGRPWKYFRHSLAKTLDGDGWQTVGLKDPPADGVLGLSGTALVARNGAPASVQAPGAGFRFLLASDTDAPSVRVLVDDAPFDDVAVRSRWVNAGGSDISLLSVSNRSPLPDAVRKVSVQAGPPGAVRLLGADFLSGRSGVAVDTLGINGARITALEKWTPRMRRLLFEEAKPSLVIVSYGTNEIGAPKFTYEGFRADCVRVLRAIREDAPGASVLVTGPIDRAVRRNGRLEPAAEAQRPVVRALREAAAETGCAFWDAQAAMGGEGSILSWMKAGLAQPDGVHLTQAGYELQGRMLFERLMAAYGAP